MLNNLKTKIENNLKLNENETLDIAFLPMFSPKEKGQMVTKEVCGLYTLAKFENEKLKQDITPIMEVMINRYCKNPNEKEELILMTIDEILEDAHRKMSELDKKEIEKQKIENEKLKQEVQRLKQENEQLKGLAK